MRRWCLLLALAGCGKDRASARAAEVGSAGSAVAAPIIVEIFVDDKPVGKLALPQVSTWPRLDALLPVSARRLGMWDDVYLKGKSAKPSELHKPSATYPELVPAVFPGADGTPSFGMFDPVELAKHGKPALREDGVTEIRVKLAQNSGRGEHDSGEGGGGDPTQLKLTIKTAKGEQVIEGAKLLAMPRSPMPGDDSKDPKGWPLTAILDTAGVKTFERMLLTDAAGMNLTLEKADFDPKTSVPFIKLNRQGQLRFRVFKKQGDGWQASGDLRALVSIQILK